MKNKIEVIKSNSKYLILKNKFKKPYVINKIAQKSEESLKREYTTIKNLISKSENFRNHFPETFQNYNSGKNLFIKNYQYFQIYESGKTLSEHIKSTKFEKKNLKFVKLFVNKLSDISNEVIEPASIKPSYYLKKLLMIEYQNIKKRTNLQFLFNKFTIYLNNKKILDFEKSMNQILNSSYFYKLDKKENFLSHIGHFNFHGENIIIKDLNNLNNFKIIDPDSRWDILDPMFSMARYFYTYHHDTSENEKYYIKTNLFKKHDSNKKINFNIKYTWSKQIKKNYKIFFDKKNQKKFDNNIDNFRFNISYLLCLLRGINANYQDEIKFINKDINLFRNSGIFFALILIKFADQLSKNIVKI